MCRWWAGAQCAGGIRLAGRARIVRGPWVSVRSQQRLDDVVSVLLRSEHQGRVAVLRGGRVCVHMAMPMMLPCVCVVLVHRAGAALLAWRRRTKFLASRSAPTFRRRLTFATSPWPAARSSAVYPLASRLCVGSKAGVADQPEHTCQLAEAGWGSQLADVCWPAGHRPCFPHAVALLHPRALADESEDAALVAS